MSRPNKPEKYQYQTFEGVKQVVAINISIEAPHHYSVFSEGAARDSESKELGSPLKSIFELEQANRERTPYNGIGPLLERRSDSWQITSDLKLFNSKGTLEIRSEFTNGYLSDNDITDSLRFLMQKGIIKEAEAVAVVKEVRPGVVAADFLKSDAADKSFSQFMKEKEIEQSKKISSEGPRGGVS